MSDFTVIRWEEDGKEYSARWRSESGRTSPKKTVAADDRMSADAAYRLACGGTAILWRGDYQNARQLLQAMSRREDARERKGRARRSATTSEKAFHLYRQAKSQRARTLGMLLLPFNADHSIPLRRAPDVRHACEEVYGPAGEPYVASLRELLGMIGAYEWRKNGVLISELGSFIHPHYGVFAPIRNEYLRLVYEAPLPGLVSSRSLAFDIGTGTGVLAAILARRGIKHIVATDQDTRAIACARENLSRLGFASKIEVVQTDLFPEGRAPLVVCNPPWVPARPSSPLEHAIFDPESRMLRGFLCGLAAHLEVGGEGWLILSDFAEYLELRSRAELLAAIDAAGLKVLGKTDIKPHHPRVSAVDDMLHAARAAELTSLWRLAAK